MFKHPPPSMAWKSRTPSGTRVNALMQVCSFIQANWWIFAENCILSAMILVQHISHPVACYVLCISSQTYQCLPVCFELTNTKVYTAMDGNNMDFTIFLSGIRRTRGSRDTVGRSACVRPVTLTSAGKRDAVLWRSLLVMILIVRE